MSARSVLTVMVVVVATTASTADAATLRVLGTGAVPISEGASPADIRTRATQAAKRQAVEAAINKVLGANAVRDARVAAKVGDVIAQVPSAAVVGRESRRVGDTYEVTLILELEEKSFRTLLSDLGISIHTATTRSFTILAVMDEFLTSPRELKAPLEELVEYRRERGARFDAAAEGEAKRRERSSSSGQARVSGRGGSARASERSRHTASDSVKVSETVSATEHDNTYYKKLIRYQPQGGTPERVSRTYDAMNAQLQDYDLKVLDNAVLRSRFFKDSAVTLDSLQKSEALDKYTRFAREEARADFFLMGTSVIIDSGLSSATGEQTCSGVVSVRTFSTVSGESIASETVSAAAAGQDINACAANLAVKMARGAGQAVAERVQNYWKRRTMYGQEYAVSLLGANMNLRTRLAFIHAVKEAEGVETAIRRSSTADKVELSVTYKGVEPVEEAIAMGLMDMPAFVNLDATLEGTRVLLCMGPCAQFRGGTPGTPASAQ